MPRAPKKKGPQETRVQLRIDVELKQKLELAAAREGMDLSSFARNTMIRRARELGFDV